MIITSKAVSSYEVRVKIEPGSTIADLFTGGSINSLGSQSQPICLGDDGDDILVIYSSKPNAESESALSNPGRESCGKMPLPMAATPMSISNTTLPVAQLRNVITPHVSQQPIPMSPVRQSQPCANTPVATMIVAAPLVKRVEKQRSPMAKDQPHLIKMSPVMPPQIRRSTTPLLIQRAHTINVPVGHLQTAPPPPQQHHQQQQQHQQQNRPTITPPMIVIPELSPSDLIDKQTAPSISCVLLTTPPPGGVPVSFASSTAANIVTKVSSIPKISIAISQKEATILHKKKPSKSKSATISGGGGHKAKPTSNQPIATVKQSSTVIISQATAPAAAAPASANVAKPLTSLISQPQVKGKQPQPNHIRKPANFGGLVNDFVMMQPEGIEAIPASGYLPEGVTRLATIPRSLKTKDDILLDNYSLIPQQVKLEDLKVSYCSRIDHPIDV